MKRGLLIAIVGALLMVVGLSMSIVPSLPPGGLIQKSGPTFPPPENFLVGTGPSLMVGCHLKNWYVISRAYLSFDTSSLEGLSLTEAVLYLGTCEDYSTNDFFVSIMGGSQPLYGDYLSSGDWGCGTLEIAKFSTVDFPSTPPFTYMNFSVPTSQINTEGLTQFELKSSVEDWNELPDNQTSYVNFWSSESEQSVPDAPEPFLKVTYIGSEERYILITASTGGTTDPSPGIYEYSEGTRITIRGIPDENYTFHHWTIDGEKTYSNSIDILMDTDHTTVAVFKGLESPEPEPEPESEYPSPYTEQFEAKSPVETGNVKSSMVAIGFTLVVVGGVIAFIDRKRRITL